MWPIPELAATVSEITDPTKASVIAIFKDPKKLAYDFDMLDRYSLQNNSFINWLKSIIFPDNTH